MRVNRDNLKWSARLISIVALMAIADALVVVFVRRPFPLTVYIPCSLPILIFLFVIMPMQKVKQL